ncbi:Deblocking aminopeptidase [Caenispirillum salinarum AK4]|uniref:Deblocking aminopeptidase n=1 Tax=Caenispirillum salinarum AK4 TaxID=1238182 RepID=K9GQS8_9PROT|nr:osmoprotectant NAGGN system M42 family peptidase [Caenispirillum salinarum]EKV27517.1 Deblocking aminopeptidase [Caenispirillum salinarum AK4]
MRRLEVDTDYLLRVLFMMLNTPSPTGMTDTIVHYVCGELESMGIDYELTRRGAIRANLPGVRYSPDRAIIGHVDTLGAIVKGLKDNGRLELAMIGHWSARFAEGARCTIYGDDHKTFRGTIMPLKASGHAFNEEIDTQPTSWQNVEVRVDEFCHTKADLQHVGINIGDHVSIDAQPEITDTGFINSRHLDDKAGVAAMLAAAKAVQDNGVELPVDCHLLFTISEEVGVGASSILHGDVAEMVSVDNGTIAPGQNTSEYGVTVAMQDMTGPFDWHLTRRLIGLCREFGIEHERDVFRYYRSDAASALEAGNDIRAALVCFAVDGSHGWERTHMKSLEAMARLLSLYMQTDPAFKRDRRAIGPKADFPRQQMQYEDGAE